MRAPQVTLHCLLSNNSLDKGTTEAKRLQIAVYLVGCWEGVLVSADSGQTPQFLSANLARGSQIRYFILPDAWLQTHQIF